MARYTGPKARVNRRLSCVVFESRGSMKALERRPDSPPGMHLRRGKKSGYGIALSEKQKIKYYYGMGERQLRRFLDEAGRQGANAGQELLKLCERRLDNVVRRGGLARSRPQARQAIVHGHFLLNGKPVDAPSMLVRPGDVIDVRPSGDHRVRYATMLLDKPQTSCDWIDLDTASLRIRMLRKPDIDDVSLEVDVNLVVELLRR